MAEFERGIISVNRGFTYSDSAGGEINKIQDLINKTVLPKR
jgi:hypothetical protein